jgi:hypothetical protein
MPKNAIQFRLSLAPFIAKYGAEKCRKIHFNIKMGRWD